MVRLGGEVDVDAEGLEEIVYGESGVGRVSADFLKRICRECLEPGLCVGPELHQLLLSEE